MNSIVTIVPFMMGVINGLKQPVTPAMDNTIPVLVTTSALAAMKARAGFVNIEEIRRLHSPRTILAGSIIGGVGIPMTIYCLGYMVTRSMPQKT